MEDQNDNISDPEQANLQGQVRDSLGESDGAEGEPDAQAGSQGDLPAFAKERIGRQEKRHKRELRAMQAQLQAMQQSMGSPNASGMNQMNSGSMQQPQMQQGGGQQDQIQQAVNAALAAQEQKNQQAQQAEKAAHVYEKYQELEDKLDSGSDKYEDFDDVVRGNAPFTPTMRDTALLLDNPQDVLYKLGKDRDALKRLSKLHPVDQAKEMVKMSVALMGMNGKSGVSAKPLGQVKNSPMKPNQITDQTSPSEIRARMKSGNWK